MNKERDIIRWIDSLVYKDEIDTFFDEKVENRVQSADFFIDVIVSENLLNLERDVIKIGLSTADKVA